MRRAAGLGGAHVVGELGHIVVLSVRNIEKARGLVPELERSNVFDDADDFDLGPLVAPEAEAPADGITAVVEIPAR